MMFDLDKGRLRDSVQDHFQAVRSSAFPVNPLKCAFLGPPGPKPRRSGETPRKSSVRSGCVDGSPEADRKSRRRDDEEGIVNGR